MRGIVSLRIRGETFATWKSALTTGCQQKGCVSEYSKRMEEEAGSKQKFEFYLFLLSGGVSFAIIELICVGYFEFVADSTCVR